MRTAKELSRDQIKEMIRETLVPIGMRWFVLDQKLEALLGRHVDLVSEASLNPNIVKTLLSELRKH